MATTTSQPKRMPAHFSESIVIRTSPAAAFAYLANPETAPIIDPAVVSYVPDTLPMRVGTVVTIKVRVFGLRLTMRSRVLEWDEGRRMMMESVRPAKPARAIAVHLFEPHPEGTLYTWSMDFVPTAFGGGLMAKFTRRLMHNNARKQQARLKRVLEDANQ